MRQRILVTPRSLTAEPHREIERMRESGFDIVYSTPGAIPTEEELVTLVPDCTGWLAGVEPVSERVIEEIACELEEAAKEAVGIANSTLSEKYDG